MTAIVLCFKFGTCFILGIILTFCLYFSQLVRLIHGKLSTVAHSFWTYPWFRWTFVLSFLLNPYCFIFQVVGRVQHTVTLTWCIFKTFGQALLKKKQRKLKKSYLPVIDSFLFSLYVLPVTQSVASNVFIFTLTALASGVFISTYTWFVKCAFSSM